MSKWVATIYTPYGKDATNPYVKEIVEADDKITATTKVKARIKAKARNTYGWDDAKIISIKEDG